MTEALDVSTLQAGIQRIDSRLPMRERMLDPRGFGRAGRIDALKENFLFDYSVFAP